MEDQPRVLDVMLPSEWLYTDRQGVGVCDSEVDRGSYGRGRTDGRNVKRLGPPNPWDNAPDGHHVNGFARAAQSEEELAEEKTREAQRLVSALQEANRRLVAAETELARIRKQCDP